MGESSDWGIESTTTAAPPAPPKGATATHADVPGMPAAPVSAGRTRLHPFNAELDAAELDERWRPGATWTAKARGLGRSHLVMQSRRMTYVGRVIVAAVHLIDAEPVPLMGRVSVCEYEQEGLYRIELELLPIPEQGPIREWVASKGK
ncbi:MAG: hypothetical protein IT432_13360 [Phycisphaerales bacterium]|nr:hypothetical protein [Phycisphaerales bacterium]